MAEKDKLPDICSAAKAREIAQKSAIELIKQGIERHCKKGETGYRVHIMHQWVMPLDNNNLPADYRQFKHGNRWVIYWGP